MPYAVAKALRTPGSVRQYQKQSEWIVLLSRPDLGLPPSPWPLLE